MVSLLSNDFWQHDFLEPLVCLFVCLLVCSKSPEMMAGGRGWRGGDSALVGASNIVRLSKNVSAECVPTDGRTAERAVLQLREGHFARSDSYSSLSFPVWRAGRRAGEAGGAEGGAGGGRWRHRTLVCRG